MTKEWLVRDPIHGYIEPTAQEIDLIDAPIFQRLRNIKQLANTYLVFPGATHTRFEHSLGTMFVASQMVSRIDSLKGEKEKERQIRLAALLHDLGHGPFSHVSEDIVARTIGEKNFGNIAIALDAFQLDGSIRDALGKDIDVVLDLLARGNRQATEYDVLDGPLDADKHDYLVRDSHYSGVPYGNPDTLRVLYTLREITRGNPPETYLGVSEKGVEAVQSLQFARYNMHRVVYNHKVRRIADAMIVRATMLAIKEDKTLDENFFAYRKEDVDFLKQYFALDDRELARIIVEKGGTSGKIMEGLARRRLWKVAYQADIKSLSGMAKIHALRIDRARASDLEEQIANDAKVDRNFVVLDKQSIENPTYREPAGIAPTSQQILVESQPQPKLIDEMPGIWGTEEKFVVDRLWVYCASEDKEKVREAAASVIINL